MNRMGRDIVVTLVDAQQAFLKNVPHLAFSRLLDAYLGATRSGYGFIAEVRFDPATNQRYLLSRAISNIAWDETSRDLWERTLGEGIEFRNLNTLFGHTLRTGERIVANDVESDRRAGGRPNGHPDMHNFLGEPIYAGNELIGMVGMANRIGGYDKEIIDDLAGLDLICAQFLVGVEESRARAALQVAQATERERLMAVFAALADGVAIVTPDGEVVAENDAFVRVTGQTLSECLEPQRNGSALGEETSPLSDYVDDARVRQVLAAPRDVALMVRGEPRWVRLSMRSTAGAPWTSQMVLVARDVTNDVRQSELLRSEAQRLGEVARSRAAALAASRTALDRTARELRASEEVFTSLLAATPSAVIVLREGQIVRANASGMAIGEPLLQAVTEVQRRERKGRGDVLIETGPQQSTGGFDVTLTIDGERHTYWVQINEAKTSDGPLMIVSAADISAKVNQDGRTRQVADSIAENGRAMLIGGVTQQLAHELNQPMHAIESYAQGCLARSEKLGLDRTLQFALRQISAEAVRAGAIVGRLRGAFQIRRVRIARFDICAAVIDATTLAGETLGDSQVEARVPDQFMDVDLDPTLFRVALYHAIMMRAGMVRVSEAARVEVDLLVEAERVTVSLVDAGAPFGPAVLSNLRHEPIAESVGDVDPNAFLVGRIVAALGGRIEAEVSAHHRLVIRLPRKLVQTDGAAEIALGVVA